MKLKQVKYNEQQSVKHVPNNFQWSYSNIQAQDNPDENISD